MDRFLKDDKGRFPPATISREEYLAVIARDVDNLLNTRSPALPDIEENSESDPSITSYGLPDFRHLSPDSPDDLWLLAAMVKETLERFEPRLENIRVESHNGESFQKASILLSADVHGGLGQLDFIFDVKTLMNRT